MHTHRDLWDPTDHPTLAGRWEALERTGTCLPRGFLRLPNADVELGQGRFAHSEAHQDKGGESLDGRSYHARVGPPRSCHQVRPDASLAAAWFSPPPSAIVQRRYCRRAGAHV